MKFTTLKELNDYAAEVNGRSQNPSKLLVSLGTCGIAAGTTPVLEAVKKTIAEKKLDNQIEIVEVGCMGLCYAEPVMMFVDQKSGKSIIYGHVNAGQVPAIIDAGADKAPEGTHPIDRSWYYPEFEAAGENTPQARIVLRNTGRLNPVKLDDYIGSGGYLALAKVLSGMTSQEVISTIIASGLRGRGGGGFPTGVKWKMAAEQPVGEKFIICNADEGDPGAFMDRAVLEGDPHSVLEAMIIGGFAIGAQIGVIYVRAEYPLAVQRLENAIAQAREAGFLGKNIFGTKFDFDIQIKLGAGAFVCGEETALIHSIEGQRGEPTVKPPYPAVKGLWKRSTIVNNVETFACIPAIIRKGADWFKSIGTEKSPGTKVFALAGKIANVGLIEVAMGTTLGDIIFKIGNGINGGRKFKAVQTGGPSGGCITAEKLDLQIDYDALKSIGSMMGSGGMIVMDEDDCMVNIAKFFLEFTLDESCGKCTPCRVGNKRMYELLQEITDGRGTMESIEKLKMLSGVIKDTALCGLGQTAPNPVLSTMANFEHEYIAHVNEKRCPAGTCANLISFVINDKCVGCGLCKKRCPVDCIEGTVRERHRIVQEDCIKCGTCFNVCKFHAIDKQ